MIRNSSYCNLLCNIMLSCILKISHLTFWVFFFCANFFHFLHHNFNYCLFVVWFFIFRDLLWMAIKEDVLVLNVVVFLICYRKLCFVYLIYHLCLLFFNQIQFLHSTDNKWSMVPFVSIVMNLGFFCIDFGHWVTPKSSTWQSLWNFTLSKVM